MPPTRLHGIMSQRTAVFEEGQGDWGGGGEQYASFKFTRAHTMYVYTVPMCYTCIMTAVSVIQRRNFHPMTSPHEANRSPRRAALNDLLLMEFI